MLLNQVTKPSTTSQVHLPIGGQILRGMLDARAFINASVSLRDKKVVGRFLGLQSQEGKDVMVVKNHRDEMLHVPSDNVVTIVSGWVIAD